VVIDASFPLLREHQTSGREIIPTTKDKLDDATNAPGTTSDIEENFHKVILVHKYIISAVDDTIDNNEVRGEVAEGDSNTVRLEMFSEL